MAKKQNTFWNTTGYDRLVPDALGGAKVVGPGESVDLADGAELNGDGWSTTAPKTQPAEPSGEPASEPTA